MKEGLQDVGAGLVGIERLLQDLTPLLLGEVMSDDDPFCASRERAEPGDFEDEVALALGEFLELVE